MHARDWDAVVDTWGWLVHVAARARPAGEPALRAGIGFDSVQEQRILAALCAGARRARARPLA